jgi:hypothetical protein
MQKSSKGNSKSNNKNIRDWLGAQKMTIGTKHAVGGIRRWQGEEEEELWGQRGPGVNEVSFRARPHHNAHSTLGVDTGATGP